MFSFFKRSKSKDSNNSSTSSSSNTDKNDKQKSNNSFFNKKNEVKRRNSGNDSKGGPSTSPTLPVKSGNSDINGLHTASVSTTNCTDKINKKTVENKGVKMGNVEDKPLSSVTDNNENKNNGEGKTEEPLKQGETNFNTPTTSVFDSGSVHHKMRAEFLNSVLTNKNMDIKNDFKNSGCGFSGVSEGVTSPSGITTTVEESDSVISQTQPVIKKEGTPDSDIIFKTAPNTPVLSRVPNITITELPSINEDINKQLSLEEIISTPNIEPIPKGNCDNISSKTNTNQTESNQNLVTQETQNNSNTKLENKTNELINHIIPKICIEMAEIEESSSDVNLNKDYITFGESENEEEDISQEISKSDASSSTPFQDKSRSISEKSDENITNDPKSNILNENNIVNNENLNDKFSDNSELLNNSELNETIVLESKNENETECNKTNQCDQNTEYSKETEDEASDSEMEDTEDKKNEETENNDEEFVEVEVEEEEEIVEPENQVKNIITDNQNTQEIINEIQVQKKNEDNSLNPEKSASSLDQQNSNISTDCEIKENLVNIESKADRQIRDLTTELKQGEKEINNLKIQVGDLQREVIVKSSGMDRLQAELTAAYKESECVRKKLKRLEEDLDSFKQKNSDLTDEINRKTESENENDYWKVIELENEVKEQAKRIKDLEQQISVIRQERDKLAQTVAELAEEREEERKIVQEALDEAMAEKVSIQEKYEREFERLRTVNTEREQKALDDFEWKLREVQAACKKRLDEKEQSSQQLIREIEGKLLIAEGKLAQLPHLKQCEQELLQVRERSIEQTRALRTATRQAEQLQNTEKLLQDEVQHLKALLEKEKSHLTTVQSIHYREISEKDRKLQFKLEQQKNELNTQWEDKLRRETQRAKTELEKQLKSEKQLALEELRQQHESKLRQLKSSWEKKHEECTKEIEHLKQKSSEKEEQFKSELETVQTNSDRDIFELRRKLDKIDVSYQEKMEKMQEKHDKEIERITEEADRKIQQCELNWQQQVGSSRTTIELVKEQMQRESQEQLQSLSEHHRAQLEEQWDQLIQERDETIALMEQKHRASMEKLRNELDSIYKSRNSRETENSIAQDDNENKNPYDYLWNFSWNSLLDTLTHLRQELSGKTTKIDSLKSNVDELHENLEVLSTEINEKNDELTNAKQTTDEKIRQREQQLEELHQGQIMELNERHQKELLLWQNNVGELQKKVAELAKKTNENHSTDMSRKMEELQRALKEKDLQVANLSKEKHLYQLELMNKETVQARQRKKGGRGGNNSGGGGGGAGSGGISNSNRSNRGGRGDHSSRQSQRGTALANHR